MDDLAVPRDERHDAREFSLIDDALHAARHALEALAGHADAFGLGRRQIVVAGDRRGLRKHRAQDDEAARVHAGRTRSDHVPPYGIGMADDALGVGTHANRGGVAMARRRRLQDRLIGETPMPIASVNSSLGHAALEVRGSPPYFTPDLSNEHAR